jgi:hypothetical protein
MTTIETSTTAIQPPGDDFGIDDAQLAAVASWPATAGEPSTPTATICVGSSNGPLTTGCRCSRPRGRTSSSIAAGWKTGDSLRRPWTVASQPCAASTASITSTVASPRAPRSTCAVHKHPSNARGLDRSELGVFLFTAEQYDRDHAALAVLLGLNGLRVSEACATNIEDLGIERGHRTLRILGKGNKPATIPLVPRTARTIDLTVGERSEGAILRRRDGERLDRRTAHRWVRSMASALASEPCTPTCSELPSSWRP